MNLRRALAHLARAGVTREVLIAGGVDPDDPAAVRAEVEALLRSALAENSILVSMRSLGELQMAFDALLTDQERDDNDALAKAIRADLESTGVLVRANGGDQFEACLDAG